MTERPNLLAGEKLLPDPQQRRSLQKRERLKAAGLFLFNSKGYEGTSVHEIARRARLAAGGFYQHFRSKRQLLLALMDELLAELSQLDLQLDPKADPRTALGELLSRAFSHDLEYLGAYHAWQEVIISDRDLAAKQGVIQAWTTSRVVRLLELLQEMPGAREGVDVPGLARVLDTLFWNLLAQSGRLSKVELDQRLESATHLIYHAMFTDAPRRTP